MHAVTSVIYNNYTSILILKHENVLDKGIKLNGVNLFNIMMYQKCAVLKST